MLRRARERHAERQRARDPAEWGVSAEIVHLDQLREPADREVAVTLGARKAIINARRSDAFTLLHQAKRYGADGQLVGGIGDFQHQASKLYVADWCERAGVGLVDIAQLNVRLASDDGQCRATRMIDAGRRVDLAHRGGKLADGRIVSGIGVGAARVLQAVVEPVVMRGEVRVWRELVRGATGETERHAQAAIVRLALESLVGHYVEIGRMVLPRQAGSAEEAERPRGPVRVWKAE